LSKIFVSYRHVARDKELADYMASRLRERAHEVFLDDCMSVGTRWVEEIESQISSSQFFLVVLSKESILSDMVRREVELAHRLAAEKKLTILPVRLAFSDELPYDLAAYLNPIQYALIEAGQTFAAVSNQIIAAVERLQPLYERATVQENCSGDRIKTLTDLAHQTGAPLPAADPRLETGAMKLGSPFYVRRIADVVAERELQREGVTLVAKGPRQSGKSSLMARVCAFARENDLSVCYIDFQLLDFAQLNSLSALLRCIAWRISRALKTAVRPETWNEMLGEKEMLTSFIEDAVLEEQGTANLFVFDEVDRVFDFPYRNDFFGLIRAWHNRRALHSRWDRLSIVLAHSTDPTLWIQDINQSPFNIGEHLELEDFNVAEVAELASRHKLILADSDLAQLMHLVGGHPFLVRQALYLLAGRSWSLSRLSDAALDERGPFGDHLRQLSWRLHQNDGLRSSMRQILRRKSCDDDLNFQRLRAAGLVCGASCDAAEMRCELYDRYFRGQFERSVSRST
jgi:AAA-like domain/TIR domain